MLWARERRMRKIDRGDPTKRETLPLAAVLAFAGAATLWSVGRSSAAIDSPLVWMHYAVLALPLGLALLRPGAPGWVAAAGAAGVADLARGEG